MPVKKSYTFYIAKEHNLGFRDYLSENARANLANPTTQSLGISDFGDRAALYIFRGPPNPPKWLRQVSSAINGVELFSTFSGAGVMLFESHERVLAVTFAHGWMYLNQDRFEADFGLKVAVNALDVGKLRRLEKSNLGDALQGVSQSPFQREFRSLWTSDALDVVSRLSGTTREEVQSDSMTGSKSLKITGEYEIADLPDLSTELVELYSSERYRETDFSIIDFVRPELDREVISELDAIAASNIAAAEQNFELALPLDVTSDACAFVFKGTGMRRTYPDLMLRHYQNSLGSKLGEVTSRSLKSHKIIASFDDGRPPIDTSIKKSLVGSVQLRDQRYAANEGNWFKIDDIFRQSIEQRFQQLTNEWTEAEAPRIRYQYDVDGNGRLEREEHYNQRLAEYFNFALLDQTEIRIPNVPRSGFEACDMLDALGKRFIHVKKSSRRSPILSHFFKQGSNSARQFAGVPSCWTQLAEVLRSKGRSVDADLIDNEEERRRDQWTVEYWIIDTPRQTGEFNIPFFSKISLHDEAQDIESRSFRVVLRFLPRAEINL
ncbi:TIGR04141 family sporadically distributed protein [Yoonia sp. 2307UL14-13]|uniref:TIGR04141 family sporadically distributed protein n=1 Tax=Yoonia sp. 2307UL14-13 TaxID=3126506 RepID=UPI00309AD0F5